MQATWAAGDDEALVARHKMDSAAAVEFPNSSGPCRFVHTQCDKELFTREYLRCVPVHLTTGSRWSMNSVRP